MDLSARTWNPMTNNVADRLILVIDDLVDKTMAAGWPPFTEPPKPDMRWEIYLRRTPDEWDGIASTDPEGALDELRDFSNMAQRRGIPDITAAAAKMVTSRLLAPVVGVRPLTRGL